MDYWLHHTFLHWEWWLLVLFTIIPWIAVWFMINKNRLYEILSYGLLVAILTAAFDSFGTNMVWWSYPHELVAMMPPLLPVDLSIIPCSMMLLYQYFNKWTSFLISNLILALFSTYIGEKAFSLLNFFQSITWKPIYSIFFYMVVAIVVKWSIQAINQRIPNSNNSR